MYKRQVHTLTEEQLGIRQELQHRLEQGLTEPALRYVTECTRHASAELALQAETLLTQLHQGWVQERDHLRENILRLVQQQQPATLTLDELQALKESTKNEVKTDIRQFMAFLEHEKTLLETMRLGPSGQGLDSRFVAQLEGQFSEMKSFCHGLRVKLDGSEKFCSQLKNQVDQQSGLLHSLIEKTCDFEKRVLSREKGPSNVGVSGTPAMFSTEMVELKLQNERLKAQVAQLQKDATDNLRSCTVTRPAETQQPLSPPSRRPHSQD